MKDNSDKKRAAALRYTGTGAPRLVAKGEAAIAERITALAQTHDIPLVEDAALIHVLSSVPLGDEIPENLYVAIAEVLAHVYRLGGMIDSFE